MQFKTLAILAALALAAGAQAQTATGPVIYPAKGQSAQQQDKDKYECHDWARRQSGFDPTQTAPAPQTAPSTGTSKSSGNAAGGMAAGAMGGAAVAELSHHDAGRGAAIGALGAATIGRMKEAQARQQQQQAQQQQQQQQQAARQSQRSVYERAFGACLEARGYTVR